MEFRRNCRLVSIIIAAYWTWRYSVFYSGQNDGNHPLTIPNVATDFPYKVILESEFGSFRDFSDNEFNIVSSGGSNTYGGDVSRTIDYTVSEFEIEVGDGVGAINDIDVNISLSGTHLII